MKFNLFSLIFYLILFSFFIFPFSFLLSIEVGGHLTEDTTWSPANNPYLVTEILYVDAGVTLTILPGTEVKVSGASCTNWVENSQNFWLINGVSVAKMFWVDGRIIAEGTEQDSIIFTRLQDDPDFYWGTIYITEQAEICRFEYCKFEYSAGIGIWVNRVANGVVSIYNGSGIIKNCSIINNTSSIITRYNDINKLEISDNIIEHGSELNDFTSQMRNFEFSFGNSEYGYEHVLVSANDFTDCFLSFNSGNFINNNLNGSSIFLSQWQHGSYIYENEVLNCDNGISGGHFGDSIYIKKNNFIEAYNAVSIDEAYVEISDNYFEGCDLETGLNTTGIIYNNIIKEGNVRTSAYLNVFQNIGFNGQSGITITYRNESCYNNLSYNNEYAFNGVFSDYYNNCIFLNNDELSQNGVHGNPIFRNCIIDFPLDPPLIDGGGNIIIDSIQAQSIFEDIQNGDFHLALGSIAIDAGFDTLGYYYPFDLDYNHRIWDGDNNGTAIIDIGPYEFGAPSFGGIQGMTYNPVNGEPVDYVLIKINNEPGEFTFSDSIGNYEYKLPTGVYDVYAERVFYDDAVEYQIEVIDGEFTQLDIPMSETVDVEEHEVSQNSSLISHLSNYPNPFNPSTTIEFSIQNESEVELSIFNMKGQKITNLINEHLPKGKHSIVWFGCDQNGNLVGSGIYLYKIKADNQEFVKRMLLLK